MFSFVHLHPPKADQAVDLALLAQKPQKQAFKHVVKLHQLKLFFVVGRKVHQFERIKQLTS